jgi:glycogen debranching enzyme
VATVRTPSPFLFFHCTGSKDFLRAAPTIRLDGTRVSFVSGTSISVPSSTPQDTATTLVGLSSLLTPIPAVQPIFETDSSTGQTFSVVEVPEKFPRGSVMVFATWMEDLPKDLDETCASGAKEAFKDLGMVELNVLLYRADGEEKDASTSSSSRSISLSRSS